MKKILLVEDNSHKRMRVIECIKGLERGVHIDEAWSYSSGSRMLIEKAYDLYLLDISLPTYDRNGSESGGRLRVFGGREIARKIYRTQEFARIAFITQFSSFSDKGNSYTFDALKTEMAHELDGKYLGMVFYNSGLSAWREELARILKEI